MRRLLSVLLLLLACVQCAPAQTLERDAVMPLFGMLGGERWADALKETERLIKANPKDTSDLMGLVNYASILSASALVADGTMSYRKLEKHVDRFVGRRLWMAAHSTTTDTTAMVFNTNKLKLEGDSVRAVTVTTNKDGTTIYCFEHYRFDARFDPSTFDGQRTRMGGVLRSYERNPNGSLIWILRLHLVHATIRKA